MARAKVYCEITCNSCGALLNGSGYYKNPSIISRLKENAKKIIGFGIKSLVETYVLNIRKKCSAEIRDDEEVILQENNVHY